MSYLTKSKKMKFYILFFASYVTFPIYGLKTDKSTTN